MLSLKWLPEFTMLSLIFQTTASMCPLKPMPPPLSAEFLQGYDDCKVRTVCLEDVKDRDISRYLGQGWATPNS